MDFSSTNEQDMLGNIEFKRFCNDFALNEKKLDFSVFVFAARDLNPNFIKLKSCIQKFITVHQY